MKRPAQKSTKTSNTSAYQDTGAGKNGKSLEPPANYIEKPMQGDSGHLSELKDRQETLLQSDLKDKKTSKKEEKNEISIQLDFEKISTTIKTYGEVAGAYGILVYLIETESKKLSEYHHLQERVTNLTSEMKEWIPQFEEYPDSPILFFENTIEIHFDEAKDLYRKIKNSTQEQNRQDIKRVAKVAILEQKKLKSIMRDVSKAAFRSNDKNLLRKISGILGDGFSIAMDVDDLVERFLKEIVHMNLNFSSLRNELFYFFKDLNNGLALINLGLTLTEKKAKTPFEEGLRKLNIAASVFSTSTVLSSVFSGVSGHIGLYSTYLSKYIGAILELTSQLTELLQDKNDEWLNVLGKLYSEDAEHGPNSGSLWPFMTKLIQAKGLEEMPDIPEDILVYFNKHQESLLAGTGGEFPTPGMLWGSQLKNNTKGKAWIYNNRSMLWDMFYGTSRDKFKK